MSAEHVARNRNKGREKFWSDPVKVSRWKRRVARQFTEQDRHIRSEEARISNKKGGFSFKGRYHDEETKKKIANAHRGRRLSDETRLKMREAALRRWHGPKAITTPPPSSRQPLPETQWQSKEQSRTLAKLDVVPHDNYRWCDQCDRRVTKPEALACTDKFCKLRPK